MKKIVLLALIAFAVFSCKKFDDSEIWEELRDHESRILKLETLCNQMNTNISSLQAIVTALQQNDYITSVSPIYEGTRIIGYTISFNRSSPVTIYHGEDGKNGVDGHTPDMGVQQYSDGLLYWTLDGNWLLDGHGNKIKASAVDGITPQLKIVDDYWYISYDNGNTWTQFDKVTGDNNSSDKGLFESIDVKEDSIVFTLSDGTIFELPMISSLLSVSLDNYESLKFTAGASKTISFSVSGAIGEITIETLSENGWKAEIIMSSSTIGKIKITAPNPIEDGKILLFVNDQAGRVVIKALNFSASTSEEEKVLTLVTDAYSIDATGGNIEVKVTTNINYSIKIPTSAQSWIKHVSTKSTRNETLTFNIIENSQTTSRSANITLTGEGISKTVTISQKGKEEDDVQIDLSAAGTANCYLIKAAGNYKFKSVKGNSTTSVGGVAKVEVIWESFGTEIAPQEGDLIASAGYKNGYITFSTPKNFREGNAGIAAKSSDGRILWSWHIWCSKDGWTDHIYANNAGIMMDRNLGAISATPGNVGALGLHYQWGRKDPFIGSSSTSSNILALSTGTWSRVSGYQSIDYTIENPTTYVTGLEWCSSLSDEQRWMDSKKTIYDPCPTGYRIPKGGPDGFWASANIGIKGDPIKMGIYWTLANNDTAWYPSANFRRYNTGVLSSGEPIGYYFSATPRDAEYGDVYAIQFYSNGYILDKTTSAYGAGCSVRCIRE